MRDTRSIRYMPVAALLAMAGVLLYSVPGEDRALRATQSLLSNPPLTERRRPVSADEFFKEPKQSLSIAWLMSFPNSGTSYTTKLVRHVAETMTASNYGTESLNGTSLAVYDDQPTGPYWLDPALHPEYTVPRDFVMTKTHCGLRCIICGPSRYAETLFSFRRRCLSGKRVTNDRIDYVSYPSHRVKRAIHLIRNPFDNIVSRFHLERHSGKTATEYPSTEEGFRRFCEVQDAMHIAEEQRTSFLDSDLLAVLEQVPCRHDFVRYIEWHNLAFATTADMEIETYVLHYDWYATRFNETTDELLRFLHLERKAEPEPFVLGKVYTEYFTTQEQGAVRVVLQSMASTTTWRHMQRYFD